MARELGGELVRVLEHPARAGKIREVGIRLAREHGEVGIAENLRVLDLRVPVGALDEPDGNAAAGRPGERNEPVDDGQGTLPVSLHGQAEPGPAGEFVGGGEPLENVEGEIQAIGFLGVDRERDAARGGGRRQPPEARQEFGEHALALGERVARVQRRELDGHRRIGGVAFTLCRRERFDRVRVGLEVSVRGPRVAGALAEHVVGMAHRLRAPAQGLPDRASEHEFRAEDMHRLPERALDDRFPEPLGQAAHPLQRIARELPVQRDEAPRQHQRPGGCIDDEILGMADVRRPGARAEPVGDEPLGRPAVGYAQQRLGQAHQGDALLVAEPVFGEKAVEHGASGAVGTDRADQRRRVVADAPGQFVVVGRCVEQSRDQRLLVRELGAAYGGAQRRKIAGVLRGYHLNGPSSDSSGL